MSFKLLQPGDPERRGALIVFEGIDGCGKSTQAKMLKNHLEKAGMKCELAFEPTDGQYGQKLRQSFASGRTSPEEELELFRLDRQEHVQSKIIPALKNGTIYLIDRYYYSSMAYQGARNYKSPNEIFNIMKKVAPVPDLTLLYNLDVDRAIERIKSGRNEVPNLMEKKENLLKVQNIFDHMQFDEIVRIDANTDPYGVFMQTMCISGIALGALNLYD